MLPANPLLHAMTPAGPHLPTATLRQYAVGTLSPAAQHRVEAHTLACARCADILEGLLQTSPATTDQALAQLQQRLRRRVQHASAAPGAARPRPVHRLLTAQLAVALTLLLGLVAGGWWTWQHRRATRPVTEAATLPQDSAAWNRKLRQAAAAFRPVAPATPLAGAVQVLVVVGVDGKIQKTKVVRGLRPDYDAEAERLVRANWPGGVAVASGRLGAEPSALVVQVPF